MVITSRADNFDKIQQPDMKLASLGYKRVDPFILCLAGRVTSHQWVTRHTRFFSPFFFNF
jgi:hypothetical protein